MLTEQDGFLPFHMMDPYYWPTQFHLPVPPDDQLLSLPSVLAGIAMDGFPIPPK